MGGWVSGDGARRVRGSSRRPLRGPESTASMRGVIVSGALLASLVLLASLALVACGACDQKPVPSDESPAESTQETALPQEAAPPAAENPLPVGQAVDAIVAPAIADVLGEPVLTNASQAEALIVNLVYQAPTAATEGDGERLLDALIDRGASLYSDQPDVDYHNEAEEFMVLYDSGDPAFQTIRVTVTPGSTDVYVNADKAL